ncbi:MAG TPA: cytochrome c family protein [Acetobacteraceae bacterium]|jgi:cytochrome c|nr:cytochrome c family protein [Acetobacteraceae bacterium]
MDSLEVNKIIAAVLVAGIAFMLAGFIAEAVVSPTELSKPVLQIALQAEQANQPAAAKPAPVPAIAPLLRTADVKKGQEFVEEVCAACHNYTPGAGTKIGPDLYGVVGRPRASVPGFNYSSALKSLGGVWTYHNLNLWLFNPQAVAPGTLMTFAGIPQTQTRADVIAFLRTLSQHLVPLPAAAPSKPAASPAPSAGKPAGPAPANANSAAAPAKP